MGRQREVEGWRVSVSMYVKKAVGERENCQSYVKAVGERKRKWSVF